MSSAVAWRIAPAGPGRIARLAEIHSEALPDDFLPSLGRAFLESVYYPAALRSPHGTTLVATAGDHPIGFVTVAHDADRFLGAVIRQHLFRIAYFVVRAILRRPRTALEALGLAWAVLTGRPDEVRGEIVFIAVDARQRGAGVGSALVGAALSYLAEQGVHRCRTKTLAANEGVIGMYRRLGWDVRERFRLIGREYATIVSPEIRRAGVADSST
jgi:ribosomal protein S18 acetylase RimI-like enzyme